MSGTLRKLERNAVKNKIKKDGRSVKRNFESEWKAHREAKYVLKDENGEVISDRTPKNTMKKKQNHFDNGEQYFRMFNYFANLKASMKAKEEAKKVEAVEV